MHANFLIDPHSPSDLAAFLSWTRGNTARGMLFHPWRGATCLIMASGYGYTHSSIMHAVTTSRFDYITHSWIFDGNAWKLRLEYPDDIATISRHPFFRLVALHRPFTCDYFNLDDD